MRGENAVLVSAILMGTLPFFIKSLMLSPLLSTFYRLFFGLVFVGIFLMIRREKPVFSRQLTFLGLLNTGTVFLYITAITYLSAAMAALLLYMAPIYVMGYAIVKGKVSKKSFISLFMGISGLYLLLSPETQINVGLSAGILSGIVYAGAFVMLNKLGKIYDPVKITFSNLLVGVFLLLPFFQLKSANPALILGLGLIPTAIPFILLAYGMARVRVEKGPVIALIEPVTAGLVGFVFFGEILSGIQLLGGIAILSGVFIALSEGE